MFPENIHRMALDGILDHTQSETITLNDKSTTCQMTLNQFFAWCNTTSSRTLHDQDPAGVYESAIRTADENPISAPSCISLGDGACRSDVTSEEVRFNLQILLLFQTATAGSAGRELLSLAITRAAKGNTILLSSPLATSETCGAYPGH